MRRLRFLLGFLVAALLLLVVLHALDVGRAKPPAQAPQFDFSGQKIERSAAEIKMDEALQRHDRIWMLVHDDSPESKRALALARSLATREKFTLVLVDANASENHELLHHRMPVQTFPTSIFVNRAGAPVLSHQGAITRAQAQAALKKAKGSTLPPKPSGGQAGHQHGQGL